MKLLPAITSKGTSPTRVAPEDVVPASRSSRNSANSELGQFQVSKSVDSADVIPFHKPKGKHRRDSGQAFSQRSSEGSIGAEEDLILANRKESKLTASTDSPREMEGLQSARSSMRSTESALRVAAECIAGHTRSNMHNPPAMKAGPVVTKKTVRINLLVVRRPGWRHGNEDGGEGRPGIVFGYDPKTRLATVYWYKSTQLHSHYYVGKKGDLSQPYGHSPLLDDKTGLAHPSMAQQAKEAIKSLFKHMPGTHSMNAQPAANVDPSARRNSQDAFSSKAQTVIIFDWDDTLFPTTYVRSDLGLSVRSPLHSQGVSEEILDEITANLAKAAAHAEQLLLLAATVGKVVVVTLARYPWVTDSCNYFYPGIGELIKSHDIQVIYAQEGEQVEYNKVNMMADADFEAFWASMKGRAIGKALEEFYSQYDGQSWKNVISIGDSDFERLGTMAAVVEYAKEHGIMTETVDDPLKKGDKNTSRDQPSQQSDISKHISMETVKSNNSRQFTFEATVNGHDFKVRTKTFKMLDEPAIEELVVELTLVLQWLPLMVKLNEGFDVDLNSLDDLDRIQDIEEVLMGRAPVDKPVDKLPSR